jgi:hypothetical protein
MRVESSSQTRYHRSSDHPPRLGVSHLVTVDALYCGIVGAAPPSRQTVPRKQRLPKPGAALYEIGH